MRVVSSPSGFGWTPAAKGFLAHFVFKFVPFVTGSVNVLKWLYRKLLKSMVVVWQGLEAAYVELKSPRARHDAFKTVLLLVNSRTDQLARAVIQANIMKNFGIKILPIAVGGDILRDELRKLATNPSDVELMQVNEVGRADALVRRIQERLCPVPRE